ncbi:helix-turn-helix domain-containing protein [Arthrobacter sp. MDT2-2]
MAIAKTKGRLRGKQPKLPTIQREHLFYLIDAGEHTRGEIAGLLGVSRTTVYRVLQRRTGTIRREGLVTGSRVPDRRMQRS